MFVFLLLVIALFLPLFVGKERFVQLTNISVRTWFTVGGIILFLKSCVF